ncbi:MAG: hypothetical protein NC321_10660 [Clostridium sp.]|nr:hypothetical protein [Clostridium sp.]
MDIFIDRLKKFLIVSTATVLLYCYAWYTRGGVEVTAAYAPIAIEPSSASIQADLDVINTYFQEQKIVVKRRMYSKRAGLLSESEYREDGQLSAWIDYSRDGSVARWREYRYDEAGNLIESTEYNISGNITNKWTYAYDEEGNIIEEAKYLDGKLYSRYECEYEYLEAGKRKKWVEYSYEDIFSYGEYEYDEAGNVKEEYRNVLGGIESYCTYQYRYNEAGDIEKEIRYDEDGSVYRWQEYRYDEAGNLLSQTASYAHNGVYERREYRYGKNGEIIKETRLVDGEITNQREYEYDEWGNLKEDDYNTYEYEYETLYTSRQPTQPVIVYKKEYLDKTLAFQTEYDRTGKEIAQIIYNSDGSVEMRTEYRYNADGREIYGAWYDGDGNLRSHSEYTYDKVGNLIEELGVYHNNRTTSTQKETYTYNEADDMIGYVVYHGDELYARYEYEYDKTGREKSYTVYNKDGDICGYSNHEYEYDDTGNVISDTAQVYDTVMMDIATGRYYTYQYQYEYDEVGRKEKEIYYMDDMMYYWYEWEYDEKGRILAQTEYDDDGSIAVQDKYEYDDDEKIIKKIHTEYGYYGKDGNPGEEITEYSYDASGNLIEERTGEISITYEYIYE